MQPIRSPLSLIYGRCNAIVICVFSEEQTVPQIVKTLLAEYQVNVEDALIENHRVWDYSVQYQESSFDFISRLMELEDCILLPA